MKIRTRKTLMEIQVVLSGCDIVVQTTVGIEPVQ